MPLQPGSNAKKVTIFVGHPLDRREGQPYARIMERLQAEGAAGAIACKAIAAFGPKDRIQTLRLAEVVPELPTVIIWVDTAEQVARILPRIRPLVREGLISVEDTTIDHLASTAVPELPAALTVGDIMTRDVLTATPDTPLPEVAVELLGRHLHAVPIVAEDGRVVGVVTVGDLFLQGGLPVAPAIFQSFDTSRFHDTLLRLTRPQGAVGDVMSAPVVTIRPDLDVRHAAELMCRRNLVRLPVTDGSDRIVGILSRADLIRAVAGGPAERPLSRPQPFQPDGASPVREIMVTEPPQVRTGDSLREVVDAVVSTRLNRAVALDEAGHVVGVVTDAELIARLTPALHPGLIRSLMHHIHFTHGGEGSERVWHQLTGKRAEDFMVRDIVIAHEDDPIRDVLAVVVEKQRQIVPVVGESGQLAGMTDRIDLLRVLIGI